MSGLIRAAILIVPLLAGCAQVFVPDVGSQTPLRPPTPSPDGVTLEIFFTRRPLHDPLINGPLWDEVDEQPLPNDLRQRLAANGIRAGMVGPQVPLDLGELLHLDDKPLAPDADPQTVNVESEPSATRRLLQLRTGRRGEIFATGIIERMSLLVRRGDQLSGHSFLQAQGLLAVVPAVMPDRRVELDLTPELHFGQARQQFHGADGILRIHMQRPREVYDELRIAARLAPGEMLLATCLPDQAGSLGYHFFTAEGPQGRQQKLLVVRLAQIPNSTQRGSVSDLSSAADRP